MWSELTEVSDCHRRLQKENLAEEIQKAQDPLVKSKTDVYRSFQMPCRDAQGVCRSSVGLYRQFQHSCNLYSLHVFNISAIVSFPVKNQKPQPDRWMPRVNQLHHNEKTLGSHWSYLSPPSSLTRCIQSYLHIDQAKPDKTDPYQPGADEHMFDNTVPWLYFVIQTHREAQRPRTQHQAMWLDPKLPDEQAPDGLCRYRDHHIHIRYLFIPAHTAVCMYIYILRILRTTILLLSNYSVIYIIRCVCSLWFNKPFN